MEPLVAVVVEIGTPRCGRLLFRGLIRGLLALVVAEANQPKEQNQNEPDPGETSFLGWNLSWISGSVRRNSRGCASGSGASAVGFCQVGEILGHLCSSL